VRIKRIDSRTAEAVFKTKGQTVWTTTYQVSPDGRTMTVTDVQPDQKALVLTKRFTCWRSSRIDQIPPCISARSNWLIQAYTHTALRPLSMLTLSVIAVVTVILVALLFRNARSNRMRG
jgi:hypothetical protein